MEQQLYTHSKTRTKTGKNQLKSTEISLGQHKTQTAEDTESDIDENDTAQNQPKKKRRRTKIRKNKNLTIVTSNINGLKGKIKSLESLLESEKIHIALITETKLKEKQKVNIKGYKWIGKNRKEKEGGGVGILIVKTHRKICSRRQLWWRPWKTRYKMD